MEMGYVSAGGVFLRLLCLVWFLSCGYASAGEEGRGKCTFPAIFNFGDSNSDTGGRSASLSQVLPPNGESFFGESSGRQCDGRLIIDFIAEKLGLPYLSPYLDSIATSFKHGANFATGGSSIQPPGYSPFHLAIQINQFLRFKSKTTSIYTKLNITLYGLVGFLNKGARKRMRNNLPRPEDFSKALYTIDIGQNDISYAFSITRGDENRSLALIPDMIGTLTNAIKVLYEEGARYFWVHNTGPIGCLPNSLFYDEHKPDNLDKYGCIAYQNRVAQEFNRQLKRRVSDLSATLQHTVFTYVDVYSAKHDLFTMYNNLGFDDPQKFCCGSYHGHYIWCGKTEEINGTVYGTLCRDPSKFIIWDGIHYSQAANLLIAERILNGSSSDPPNPISGACHGR